MRRRVGLRVELAGLLQDLGSNGNGAVDRVRNHEDVGVRAVLRAALDQALDDAGVDLEEVVTGHSGLAYVTCMLGSRPFRRARS